MIEGKYNNGIGISAGSFMIKWDIMDNIVKSKPLEIKPADNINVFINFESIMNNMFKYKGINSSLLNHKQKVVIELESSILNLVANYKAYFRKEKCNVKIFLYYTDLENKYQQMSVYNKFYRTFYTNKYLQNPKFKNLGEVLKNIIIPELGLIMSYIPDVYFVSSKGFDSSLIPMIISNKSNSKNLIISNDIFDSLYMFHNNFLYLYIKRKYGKLDLVYDLESFIQYLIPLESPFNLNIFRYETYYRTLLSVLGSDIRNIKKIRSFTYEQLIKKIDDGIKSGTVLNSFESLSSIKDLFSERVLNEIKTNFDCMSIENQYDLLTDIDIDNINSQIVDKIDNKSLESLNNKRFFEYPLNIQSLLN